MLNEEDDNRRFLRLSQILMIDLLKIFRSQCSENKNHFQVAEVSLVERFQSWSKPS